MLDLRKPAGAFFLALGAMLTATGMLSPARPALSPEINVNLWSGLVMGLFGAALLLLALRSR